MAMRSDHITSAQKRQEDLKTRRSQGPAQLTFRQHATLLSALPAISEDLTEPSKSNAPTGELKSPNIVNPGVSPLHSEPSSINLSLYQDNMNARSNFNGGVSSINVGQVGYPNPPTSVGLVLHASGVLELGKTRISKDGNGGNHEDLIYVFAAADVFERAHVDRDLNHTFASQRNVPSRYQPSRHRKNGMIIWSPSTVKTGIGGTFDLPGCVPSATILFATFRMLNDWMRICRPFMTSQNLSARRLCPRAGSGKRGDQMSALSVACMSR